MASLDGEGERWAARLAESTDWDEGRWAEQGGEGPDSFIHISGAGTTAAAGAAAGTAAGEGAGAREEEGVRVGVVSGRG